MTPAIKPLCALIYATGFVVAVWVAAEVHTEAELAEIKSATDRAMYAAKEAEHRAEITEQMIFFLTKYDYPAEKFGCPIKGGLYKSVKVKGKVKKVRVC